MQHKDSIVSVMWIIAIAVQVLLPVVFFNSLGLSVLLYLGCFCIAAFFVTSLIARNEFNKHGGIPEGKNCMYTTNLVNGGIYSVVRHPMYASWILLVLTLPLFSQHWLGVLLGVTTAALIYNYAVNEDKRLIRKFGDTYREYMKTVPRVNMVRGIYGYLRKRNHNAVSKTSHKRVLEGSHAPADFTNR
ncbi:MAG: isoprenylcysteine carboxylmethyltransferase family protein [Candidatus Bathyarchaeia archaeon]